MKLLPKQLIALFSILIVALATFTFVTVINISHTKDSISNIKSETTKIGEKRKNVAATVASSVVVGGSFNLQSAEQITANNLNTAFTDVYGGIQTDSDYKAAEAKLPITLGKPLTKHVLSQVKIQSAGKTSYLAKNNIETSISFGSVSANKHVSVHVFVSYALNSNSDKIMQRVFTLNYDLQKQKVLDYQDQNITQRSE